MKPKNLKKNIVLPVKYKTISYKSKINTQDNNRMERKYTMSFSKDGKYESIEGYIEKGYWKKERLFW